MFKDLNEAEQKYLELEKQFREVQTLKTALEDDTVVNVGVSGPGVVKTALENDNNSYKKETETLRKDIEELRKTNVELFRRTPMGFVEPQKEEKPQPKEEVKSWDEFMLDFFK